MSKHVKIRMVALLLCAVGIITAYEQLRTEDVMLQAAKNFLASLSAEQKERAILPFGDQKRVSWHFFPDGGYERTYKHARPGVAYKEMGPSQLRLADALLSASLSQAGFIKAVTIMSLEEILGDGDSSKAEHYYYCFFGKPSASGTWGLRVEGHHGSFNFTMKDGTLISTSPMFFGADPHEIREGQRAGLRALSREEDLARSLVKSLSKDQSKQALIEKEAIFEIVTNVDVRAKLEGDPRGLQASKMNHHQTDALMSLIVEYAANVPADVAAKRMQTVKDTPRDQIYFAWAGSTEPNQGHYYRVQGPEFLIEYANTRNNSNHSHTVWRDPTRDFALDVFALHHRLYDHDLEGIAAD